MANGRGNPDGSAFHIGFDTSGADAWLDGIQRATEESIRPAAQAGAEELYLEARLRVPQSAEPHYFYGKNSKSTGVRYYFEPGSLRNAIYQVYSKGNSGKARATYHIAWNHQKVPYGFMVEFGTSRAPAHPFLRPAYAARRDFAMEVARAYLVQEVKKAI